MTNQTDTTSQASANPAASQRGQGKVESAKHLLSELPASDLLAEVNRRGLLQPLYGAIGAMHDHLDRTGSLDERLTQYLAYRLRREEAAITGMPDSAARVANWQECIDQIDRDARDDSPSPGM